MIEAPLDNTSNPIIEALLLESMPMCDGLINYCKQNRDFADALKFFNYRRFIALQAINVTRSSRRVEDEILGIYMYDYGLKSPIFKQDFIVNVGYLNNRFVLYTGMGKLINGRNIRHINEFLRIYDVDGFYRQQHRLSLDQLGDGMLRQRGLTAISIAEKRKANGNPQISEEQAEQLYSNLIHIKKRNSTD